MFHLGGRRGIGWTVCESLLLAGVLLAFIRGELLVGGVAQVPVAAASKPLLALAEAGVEAYAVADESEKCRHQQPKQHRRPAAP